MITRLYTVDKEGDVVADGVFCIKQEYTEPQLTEYDAVAAEWELYVETFISFIEWDDYSKYVLKLDRNMYVVRDGVLSGFCFDNCYFDLADPDTHSVSNYHPDPARYGRNFIGHVSYTLRKRTDCPLVEAIKV